MTTKDCSPSPTLVGSVIEILRLLLTIEQSSFPGSAVDRLMLMLKTTMMVKLILMIKLTIKLMVKSMVLMLKNSFIKLSVDTAGIKIALVVSNY